MDSENKENILLLLTKNKKQYYMLNFDFFFPSIIILFL